MTKIEHVTPDAVNSWLLAGEAILIDVREPDEYAAGHIAHAVSVPLSSGVDGFLAHQMPLGKKIVMQCFKGARGEQACARLGSDISFKNELYNLEGGITAWRAAGLPVVEGRGSKTISIFRQVQIIMGALIASLIGLGVMVSPVFLYVAVAFSLALFVAGVTGWCGLGLLLQKMPWNA